jgi:hypothetical protein
MDLLPKVTGMEPYQGGTQQRPGTGTFARRRKPGEARPRSDAADDPEPASLEVDPLLAEIDRLRALEPGLTESGQHRALRALRAYQHVPGDHLFPPDDLPAAPPAADAAAHVSTRVVARPPPPTGSDGAEA